MKVAGRGTCPTGSCKLYQCPDFLQNQMHGLILRVIIYYAASKFHPNAGISLAGILLTGRQTHKHTQTYRLE